MDDLVNNARAMGGCSLFHDTEEGALFHNLADAIERLTAEKSDLRDLNVRLTDRIQRLTAEKAAAEAEVKRLREAVERKCAKLINEAQAEIDANMKDVMPSRTVENLWLGRRLGVENALSEFRAALKETSHDQD